MYRFYINTKKYFPMFFLFLLILLIMKNLNPYRDTTWGNYYIIEKNSPVYYSFENEQSIYTVESGEIVMCDSKYEDEFKYSKNNRLFCWYLFKKNKEPISGWINIDSMRIKND